MCTVGFFDFGASVNVMSLFVAKIINEKWDKIDAQIIKLYNNLIHTIGQLIIMLIHLSYDQGVHQCIHIVIVHIQES